MKKYCLFRIQAVLIILITALLLPVIALAETEPEQVVLSAETIVIDLAEDDEAKLTGYILPAEAEQDIDWKTNDRDIARYSSGKIRGREIGTTYITATSEEDPSVSAVCQIVVIDSDIPESVVLSQYSAELDLAGNTKLTLSASALPAGANQRVSWKTSSSSIAKVSSSGVVTARRTGTAVITAYSKESSKVYAECIVTVIDSDIPEYIGLNQTNITLDLRNNTSFDLDAVAYPPFANQDIEWDSSSSSVVRVSSKGVLTARKVGTATVKAISEESSKVYAECLVTVIDTRIPESISFENADETLTMDRYQTVTLMPVVEPSFADQRVEWKSSNSSVVSVSDAGKLTAKKAGTATITCKSERSGAVKASLTVTVKQYPTPDSITLLPTPEVVVVGEKIQLIPAVTPVDSKVCEYFTWKTSSSSRANVSPDGLLTAKKTGWVTITCESKQNSRVKATRKFLIVSESSPHSILLYSDGHSASALNGQTLTVNPGDFLDLSASVLPAGKNADITWKSGSTSRATVASDGLVSVKKAGTVTITATSKANKEIKASITLKIVNLPAPDAIQLNASASTIEITDKLQLSVTTYPVNEKRSKEFKWSTSSSSIASISSTGILTPKKTGTVTVTVKSGRDSDVKSSITIKIIDSKMPDSVQLAESGTITIESGQKIQLNATVKPSTATQTLKWSSNSSRVRVDQNGVVTGIKSGTATITVTSTYSKYREDSVKIKVVSKSAPSALSLSAVPQAILVGESTRIVPAAAPVNASVLGTYTSSNPAIATVDPDGVVTAHATGTAVITLQSQKNSAVKASLPIIVYDANTPGSISLSDSMIYLVKGDNERAISASVFPATAPQTVTWSSSNSDVVRVSSDGVLTARDIGTAIVTARTTNGLSAQCKVSVTSVYVATTIPARTTPVSGIAENLKKINDIKDSAKSEILRLAMNDRIDETESLIRQGIIDRAFEMQLFPWMTESIQPYWTSEYAYKQYLPGQVYYGLPYIQKNLNDSYDNREYNVAKAVRENRYTDSGNGYYLLNRKNLLGKMYVGNDCSSFMGISQYGINHPAAFIRTKYIFTSSYYETIKFADMRPGDLFVMGSNHTVMFLYWVDAAKTQMMIIEQGGDGNTVICSIHDLSYYSSQGYIARRRVDFN